MYGISYILLAHANDPTSQLETITICNLRKVFGSGFSKGKVAVDNVSLGIPKGECFGFLGTNGAGKTTVYLLFHAFLTSQTLSILTHDLTPTSGDAWIAGHSVTTDFQSMQTDIGYWYASIMFLLLSNQSSV